MEHKKLKNKENNLEWKLSDKKIAKLNLYKGKYFFDAFIIINIIIVFFSCKKTSTF
jgi:hypothetical protein